MIGPLVISQGKSPKEQLEAAEILIESSIPENIVGGERSIYTRIIKGFLEINLGLNAEGELDQQLETLLGRLIENSQTPTEDPAQREPTTGSMVPAGMYGNPANGTNLIEPIIDALKSGGEGSTLPDFYNPGSGNY